MRKYCFILFIALSPVIAIAQNGKEGVIMMKMLALRNALLSKDSVVLNDLLANDVSYGHTNGMIQAKAELIRSVMSGEQDYKNIVPSDMKIRFYDNTAIVTMKSAVSMLYQGNQLDMNMFVTLVWVFKNKWQLVARQSVKQ
jgi:hypothetical protein